MARNKLVINFFLFFIHFLPIPYQPLNFIALFVIYLMFTFMYVVFLNSHGHLNLQSRFIEIIQKVFIMVPNGPQKDFKKHGNHIVLSFTSNLTNKSSLSS